MSAIRLRGATSGTTDVVAAAIAGDGVLTLPTGTGTLATAAYVDAAVAAGGKVLQVVQGTTTTAVTSNSATVLDTGLTATITPSLATSKILVMVNQYVEITGTSVQNPGVTYKLKRDATEIGGNFFDYWASTVAEISRYRMTINYLDLPDTTSAVVYKTTFLRYDGVAIVQQDSTISTITLMEIAA